MVACDAAATADGVNVNAVYNGIKSNTNFTDMLTKTTNAGESGMSITKTANGTYDDLGYVNGTSGNSVIVSTSNPFFNIIAGGHTHPPGKNDGPSPGDIYHLLQGKLGNDNYNTDFVFAANGKQYAITISDKAAALKFLVDYPPSTNLNGADWSGTPNDNSLYSNFLSYERTLRAEGYPQEMWEEYGLVYLMSDPKYNMGIKLLQNVNGIFKELNVNLYRDAAGKGHFGIKICQ